MLWLYRFILGYLWVEFYGDIPESILNICAKNGITLWNSKVKKGKIFAKILIRDFKILRRFTKKSGIRAHILKKNGLPFMINRYKKRFGIPIGIILFFFILEFLSSFIWSIEVSGNKQIKESEILSICKEIGIYEGVKAEKINPQYSKQSLLLKTDKLAWASLNIECCRLTVEVSETKNEDIQKSIPTNLISTADGIITKINVKSGNCIVKVGDTVAKGDLLVSGIIERENETKFVHSEGSVTAITEKEIEFDGYFNRTLDIKTGKVKKRSVLTVFGIKIPLYLGRIKGTYISENNVTQWKLLGKKLPISLNTKTFYLTDTKHIKLSEDKLKEELENKLKEGKYNVKNMSFENIEGGIRLKSLISSEEEITTPEKILINSGN